MAHGFSCCNVSVLHEIGCEHYVPDQRIADAYAEIEHWKHLHSNMVHRCALLRQRPDLPVDRIPAYEKLIGLQQKIYRERTQLADANKEIEELKKRINRMIDAVDNADYYNDPLFEWIA